MSKINDLIKKLCPNGVEYKKIADIAEVGTGNSNRQDAVEDGVYPFYVRSKEVFRINKFEYDEEAIIIPGEGRIGEIFHYVNGKYALHQRAYRIHIVDNRMMTKFLYYYMFNSFKDFIMLKAVNAIVTSIRKPMIEQFSVPIPPIEVQNEIIRILDKFSALEAELEAELEERKKQYAFWCKKSFELKNAPIKKLKEISKIIDSLHATPKYVSEGYPMIRVADVKFGYIDVSKTLKVTKEDYNKFISKYKPVKDDIIISRVGSFGNICLVGNEEVCLGQNTSIIHTSMNSKYLYYYLSSNNVQNWIKENVNGAGYKSLSLANINEIPIKVPTKLEQERIVNVLDKFDRIINDLSVGIPAEIELRRKQYQYYRDKLLSFEAINEKM